MVTIFAEQQARYYTGSPRDHSSARAQEEQASDQRPLYVTEENQSASVGGGQAVESRQRLCWGMAACLY